MEKATQNLDRRQQRTRQLLYDALFKLIIERGYESLTVGDITEFANIGRTTFYFHYQDKDDLLRTSVKALMAELQNVVEFDNEKCPPYELWCVRIFEHIAQRHLLYRALLKETGPVNIGNLMRTYFSDLFQRYTLDPMQRKNFPALKREILAAHAAGSLFGLLTWWLEHDLVLGPEKMGAIFFQLMVQGGADIPL